MSRPKKQEQVPGVNSFGKRELDRAQEKFDKFDEDVKNLTLDRMNESPKEEREPQTQLTAQEFKKAPDIYLKPKRSMPPSPHPKTGKYEVFNEKFRDAYNYDKEYVPFIAENIEVGGEAINLWTKPYPGVAAEEWVVPVNKPIYGPRYLAERIKKCCYHRMHMEDHSVSGSDYAGTYVGGIIVDGIKHRLDAHPAPKTQVSFNRKVSGF